MFLTTQLTCSDVVSARRALAGAVVRTPVLQVAALDAVAGARLLVKAENLQTGGSYKMRGATLAIARLAGSAAGVIAQSTGNHAVAVALAARAHAMTATVVLPLDAAPTKIAQARAAGAEVVLAGVTLAERLDAVRALHDATGHPVVDAYDHRDVVCGQGTATAEFIEQAEGRRTPLDAVVVPVGGGGGAAGACLATEGRPIAVYGVEPVGCDSLARSLAAGHRVPVTPAPTLADGLRPSCVGELPFEILRGRISGVLHVDDDAIAAAFRMVVEHVKVVAEPSGAAGLAGALQLAATGRYRTIGVLLTGGNVDADLTTRLLAGAADRRTA